MAIGTYYLQHHSDKQSKEPLKRRIPPAQKRQQTLYRGHRRQSFITYDIEELTELRATNRTFEGAYFRTSVQCLTMALVILKMFSHEYVKVSLLFILLFVTLAVAAWARFRHTRHLIADDPQNPLTTTTQYSTFSVPAYCSQGQRIWGSKPFKTCGSVVIVVFSIILCIQIVLFVLIMEL